MLQSMTGFAAKTITLALDKERRAHVTIHLKSLNARHLEVNCKLPLQLSHLETDFIKLFKDKLYRGYIYFTIYVDSPNIFKGNIEPAMVTIDSYIIAIKRIKKKYAINDPISLTNILSLENIFNVEEKNIDEHVSATILKTTNILIDAVITERNQEGKQLKKDFDKRLAIMQQEISIIEQRAQKIIEEQKIKVNQVLQELRNDTSDVAEIRKNTLYAALDKMDIHEEMVRFKAHVHNINQQLKSPDTEKGKRLDFTLQELAREINTITAKCSDALISAHAINIKVEIEKIREQVQNIV